MIPSDFPQSNITLTPPDGMDESQVQRIQAFHGDVTQGNLDGAHIVVTCWKPTPAELAQLNAGEGVFVVWLGCVPPHSVNVGFPY